MTFVKLVAAVFVMTKHTNRVVYWVWCNIAKLKLIKVISKQIVWHIFTHDLMHLTLYDIKFHDESYTTLSSGLFILLHFLSRELSVKGLA